MKIKNENNIEFLTRVMEFSRHGALAQMVVITAIDNYTKRVLADEEETLKALSSSFVSGPAWIAACKEIRGELDARLAPRP